MQKVFDINGQSRNIDATVAKAQRDLKSRFGLVAKARANIWATVAFTFLGIGILIGVALVASPTGFVLRGAGIKLQITPSDAALLPVQPLGISCPEAVQDAEFKVISPKTGDLWQTGERRAICWTPGRLGFSTNQTVKISISKARPACLDLPQPCKVSESAPIPLPLPAGVDAIANTGIFIWDIPTNLPSEFIGTEQQITVELAGTETFARSGVFSLSYADKITNPVSNPLSSATSSGSINILDPDPSKSCAINGSCFVQWQSIGVPLNSTVSITLHRPDGSSPLVLKSGVPIGNGYGNYSSPLPSQFPSANLGAQKITVKVEGTDIKATSPVFNITGTGFRINNLNLPPSCTERQVCKITWDTEGISQGQTVKIYSPQLSNGTGNVTPYGFPIIYSGTNSGSYNWIVPENFTDYLGPFGPTARLRLSIQVGNTQIYADSSNEVNFIRVQPTIEITNPKKDDSWYKGQGYLIEWTARNMSKDDKFCVVTKPVDGRVGEPIVQLLPQNSAGIYSYWFSVPYWYFGHQTGQQQINVYGCGGSGRVVTSLSQVFSLKETLAQPVIIPTGGYSSRLSCIQNTPCQVQWVVQNPVSVASSYSVSFDGSVVPGLENVMGSDPYAFSATIPANRVVSLGAHSLAITLNNFTPSVVGSATLYVDPLVPPQVTITNLRTNPSPCIANGACVIAWNTNQSDGPFTVKINNSIVTNSLQGTSYQISDKIQPGPYDIEVSFGNQLAVQLHFDVAANITSPPPSGQAVFEITKPAVNSQCFVDNVNNPCTIEGQLPVPSGSPLPTYAGFCASQPMVDIYLNDTAHPIGENTCLRREGNVYKFSLNWSIPASLDTRFINDGQTGGATVKIFARVVGNPSIFANSGSFKIVKNVASSPQKLSQTIDFGALENKFTNSPAFTVSANASSGLPVSFSIVSGPATVNGNQVNITGAGTVTVKADQAGNSTYSAAPSVVRSFQVIVPVVAPAPAITNVALQVNADGTATVFWKSVNLPQGSKVNVELYLIFQNNEIPIINLGQGIPTAQNADNNSTGWSSYSLLANGTYKLKVSVLGNANISKFSDNILINK